MAKEWQQKAIHGKTLVPLRQPFQIRDMLVQSFPPIARPDCDTLILGSMPGQASLAAGQYYAHKQNHFWPIMGALVGAKPDLPYEDRLWVLMDARIAVWDVLQSCVRPGSLDSAISAEIPNDFVRFFNAHKQVNRVFFNGLKAESSFRRHVLPCLPQAGQLQLFRLPSTSPAHAGRNLAAKLALWQAVTDHQAPSFSGLPA